ncbi:MAG: DUF4337 family protein [Candidatus Caenarcaniphilales bacterium]|nr:DUF4337 family protein [Candidatus Caenarcaniphilales bacterium]
MVFFNKPKENEAPNKTAPNKLVFFLFLFVAFLTVLTNFFKEESSLSVNVHLSVKNNLWSHYGFKSLKSKMYELERNNFVFSAQALKDETRETVLTTLIDNLGSEIGRYKKEQNSIQADAEKADTKYELARKRYLMFLISFSLALLGFLLCSYLVTIQLFNNLSTSHPNSSEHSSIFEFKNILGNSIVILSLVSIGFLIYGFWLAI